VGGAWGEISPPQCFSSTLVYFQTSPNLSCSLSDFPVDKAKSENKRRERK